MDTTTSIFLIVSVIIQIILFIAIIFLVLSMIKVIKSLSVRIEFLQRDFDDFKKKIEPGIEDSIILIKKVNKIADSVENNINKVEEITDKFKDFSEEVIEFGSKIKERIEPPVLDTIITFTAVFKGIKTFFEKLKSHDKIKSSDANYLFEEKDKISESPGQEKMQSFDKEVDESGDINKELNEVRKKLEEMKKV